MKYYQSFLTLKGLSASSMCLGQPGICQFNLLNFHIIPNPLHTSQAENLLPGLTSKIF